MSPSISHSDLQILHHEAELVARRLVRRLRLPNCDLADLRQELLLDLIARLPAFDPLRGSPKRSQDQHHVHGAAVRVVLATP